MEQAEDGYQAAGPDLKFFFCVGGWGGEVERVEGEDKFFFSFRLGFLLFVKRDGEKKKKHRTRLSVIFCRHVA